jgi:hypothetical protein
MDSLAKPIDCELNRDILGSLKVMLTPLSAPRRLPVAAAADSRSAQGKRDAAGEQSWVLRIRPGLLLKTRFIPEITEPETLWTG